MHASVTSSSESCNWSKEVNKLPKQIRFGSEYYKMNCGILDDPEFQINFDEMWEEVVEEQEDFEDIARWWEHAKVEISIFLQNFPATLMSTKRDLKELIYFMLGRATAEKDWNEVAVERGKLENMMCKDRRGFIVRNRFKENPIFWLMLTSTTAII